MLNKRKKLRKLLTPLPDVDRSRITAEECLVYNKTGHIWDMGEICRIRYDFDRGSGVMLSFCVQQEIFLDGQWREVIRYDASQKELPHIHRFNPDPMARVPKLVIGGDPLAYGKHFHEALNAILDDFQENHSNYFNAYECK